MILLEIDNYTSQQYYPLIADIIGYTAGCFVIASFISMFIKLIKNRSAHDITWWFLFFQIIPNIEYLIYGVLIKSYPLIVSGSANSLLIVLISFIKIYFDSKRIEYLQMD